MLLYASCAASWLDRICYILEYMRRQQRGTAHQMTRRHTTLYYNTTTHQHPHLTSNDSIITSLFVFWYYHSTFIASFSWLIKNPCSNKRNRFFQLFKKRQKQRKMLKPAKMQNNAHFKNQTRTSTPIWAISSLFSKPVGIIIWLCEAFLNPLESLYFSAKHF